MQARIEGIVSAPIGESLIGLSVVLYEVRSGVRAASTILGEDGSFLLVADVDPSEYAFSIHRGAESIFDARSQAVWTFDTQRAVRIALPSIVRMRPPLQGTGAPRAKMSAQSAPKQGNRVHDSSARVARNALVASAKANVAGARSTQVPRLTPVVPATRPEEKLGLPSARSTGPFVQPEPNGVVTVPVTTSAWMLPGLCIYIADATRKGGSYVVERVVDSKQVLLKSLGYQDDSSPGTTVASGAGITPSGIRGPAGALGATGAPGSAASTVFLQGAVLIRNAGAQAANAIYGARTIWTARVGPVPKFTIVGQVTAGRTLTVEIFDETANAYVSAASGANALTITSTGGPSQSQSSSLAGALVNGHVYSVRARLDSNNGSEAGFLDEAEITPS